MRSITTTLPHLDSAPQHPPQPRSQRHPSESTHSALPLSSSPAMDLQYILSPGILLDDKQQQRQQPQQPQQSQSAQLHAHPPLVFQEHHQLVPPSGNESSSSRALPPAPHVHPNPDDAIISFDSRTRSFPKPTKSSPPAAADPYAEGFLRDTLGPDKWDTFSTRLFERRLGGKGKAKAKPGDDDDPKAGASAIEFLVKVELVKSILREFVPHPYNPRKSLSHPYSPAPSGHVTLTRSTVLLLCGWSNTQFSYWARRSEAVSVLAEHDPRLSAVGTALERRLRGDAASAPDDEDESAAVTGKGLDAIIEDVKKRTGKSQFLRGKHSSLDPFGTAPPDPTAPPPSPQYAMPTFQAEHYDHEDGSVLDYEAPPSMGPRPPPVDPPAPPPKPRIILPPLSSPPHAAAACSSSSAGQLSSASTSASPSQQASPSPLATRAAVRQAPVVTADDNSRHFPVSDSRSEVEKPACEKRKASDDVDEPPQKRPRTC